MDPRRDRCLCASERGRWRSIAKDLDDRLVFALVESLEEGARPLARWAQTQDEDLQGEAAARGVGAYLLSLRPYLLGMLAEDFQRLRSRETTRAHDVHRAALLFENEFRALSAKVTGD